MKDKPEDQIHDEDDQTNHQDSDKDGTPHARRRYQ